jgi:hypothetical protein
MPVSHHYPTPGSRTQHLGTATSKLAQSLGHQEKPSRIHFTIDRKEFYGYKLKF